MRRVLLVDDNRLERKIISHTLTSRFNRTIKVDEVTDGSQALKYLDTQQYDLVITDLVMPNIEGIRLIHEIHKYHSPCKIIAISGSNPYYLYLAKKTGIDGVFTKPVPKDLFLQKIEALLSMPGNQSINN